MKSLKMITRFLWLSAVMLLSVATTMAQDGFAFKAGIGKVDHPGFFKIELSPGLLAKSKADMSDIRLIDNKGSFVPFSRFQTSIQKDDFVQFPILRTLNGDSLTTLIVLNDKRLLLESLWLNVKNTEVHRNADLLGSDDQQEWFAIKENIALHQTDPSNSDNFFQKLLFPSNSYKYFKIKIYNRNKEAIKILKAGIFTGRQADLQYAAMPSPIFKKIDSSNNSTYLHLIFKEPYLVNKIKFDIRGPKYYKRTVVISELNGRSKRRITETILRSSDSPQVVTSTKSKAIEVQIFNGDNPPLQINELRVFQLKESLVAYLESDVSYELLVGNNKAQMPDYDLKYFADSSSHIIGQLQHSRVEANSLFKIPEPKSAGDNTKVFWLALVIVLAILIFFSWKMIQEIKTRT